MFGGLDGVQWVEETLTKYATKADAPQWLQPHYDTLKSMFGSSASGSGRFNFGHAINNEWITGADGVDGRIYQYTDFGSELYQVAEAYVNSEVTTIPVTPPIESGALTPLPTPPVQPIIVPRAGTSVPPAAFGFYNLPTQLDWSTTNLSGQTVQVTPLADGSQVFFGTDSIFHKVSHPGPFTWTDVNAPQVDPNTVFGPPLPPNYSFDNPGPGWSAQYNTDYYGNPTTVIDYTFAHNGVTVTVTPDNGWAYENYVQQYDAGGNPTNVVWSYIGHVTNADCYAPVPWSATNLPSNFTFASTTIPGTPVRIAQAYPNDTILVGQDNQFWDINNTTDAQTSIDINAWLAAYNPPAGWTPGSGTGTGTGPGSGDPGTGDREDGWYDSKGHFHKYPWKNRYL